MGFSTAIFVLVMVALSEAGSERGLSNHRRVKRSSTDLGRVVACAQSQGLTWAMTNYGCYGCYCGFGGRGNPVDATDRCCKAHDECWINVANNRGENVKSLKYKSYDYTCRWQQITCNDADGVRRDLCECDKAFSLCVKRNRNTYDSSHRNCWRTNC